MLRLVLLLLVFYLLYGFWIRPLLTAKKPVEGPFLRDDGPRDRDMRHRRRPHRPSSEAEDADYEEIR